MDTTFDPAQDLFKANPQISEALKEWDNLLADRRALVREVEESQKMLDEVDEKIQTYQREFPSRFVVSVKPAPQARRTTRETQKPAPEAPKAPPPSRESKARPTQSIAQWYAGVRGCLTQRGINEALLAGSETWWRARYEQGLKPAAAVKEWLKEQPAEPKATKTPSPPKAEPAALPAYPLSEPNPDGIFVSPAKLGISEHDLNLAISKKLYRPDEGKHAEIGFPLSTNKGLYAVVMVNERSSHTVYHLQPVEGAAGKRRIQIPDRHKQFPQLAPEDIPLCGVYAVDEKGFDYVFGPDEKRIFVEVPKRKAGTPG